MRSLTVLQSVREALSTALATDDRVLLLGQDVGRNGGVFRATDGLFDQFGERVVDMPISEAAMVGAAVGLAAVGFVPVVELQFLPFAHQAFHQLVDQLPRMRNRSQGRFPMQVTVRAPYGGLVRAPELHSDAIETQLTSVPGLKVVAPATAHDAKGLLLAAVRDPDPVVVLEPIAGYRAIHGDVPEHDYTTPFAARPVRLGDDVVLVAWGAAVGLCERVARAAESESISCAVLDLRSLVPLDVQALTDLATATGRVVVVHEAPVSSGFGAEVAATVQEHSFRALRAAVLRVGAPDVPYPFYGGERLYLPTEADILRAVRATMES